MIIKDGQISPYILRYFIVTAILLTALFFLAIIFSAIGFAHSKAPPVAQLPPALMPGNPLPNDASCVTGPYPSGNNLYCYMMLDDTLVYFMFSSMQGTIERLSYSPRAGVLGDLILAWGTPSGMNRLTWAVEVHWGNRVVYVSDKPFGPESRIHYVAYNLMPDHAQPWRGFVNNEN
jgi:hypothetical protein